MKVDFPRFGLERPDNTKTGRVGQTEAAGTGASSTAGLDQAHFSFDQTQVQSLKTQILAQPELREAKVRALRHAIGNGEYSVPPGKLADALISELSGA
jgi:flagellar biosynthesis anti-sigma factor FlgM